MRWTQLRRVYWSCSCIHGACQCGTRASVLVLDEGHARVQCSSWLQMGSSGRGFHDSTREWLLCTRKEIEEMLRCVSIAQWYIGLSRGAKFANLSIPHPARNCCYTAMLGIVNLTACWVFKPETRTVNFSLALVSHVLTLLLYVILAITADDQVDFLWR